MKATVAAPTTPDPAAAESSSAEVGDLETIPAAPQAAPFFALVTGGPHTAQGEQARRLAERYQVPAVTLTDLVLDAGDLKCERPGGDESEQFGDFLYEQLIGWEVDAQLPEADKRPAPYKALALDKLTPLITRAVCASLRQPKYAHGLVIDGLQCEFGPAQIAVQALLDECGLTAGTAAPVVTAAGVPAGAGAAIWVGDKRVWMVAIELSAEDAAKRVQATVPQPETSAPLPVEGQAAAADPAAASELVDPKQAEVLAAAAQAAQAAVLAGVIAKLAEYVAERDRVFVLARDTHPDSAVQVLRVGDKGQDAVALADAIAGVRFDQDALQHVMPRVAADADRIAPPYLLQVRASLKSMPFHISALGVLSIWEYILLTLRLCQLQVTGRQYQKHCCRLFTSPPPGRPA